MEGHEFVESPLDFNENKCVSHMPRDAKAAERQTTMQQLECSSMECMFNLLG